MNKRQRDIASLLYDDGFVDEKVNSSVQIRLTKELKDKNVIRVVLDTEGEREGCITRVYVFDGAYKGLPLLFEAEFSFLVPIVAIYNYITTLNK